MTTPQEDPRLRTPWMLAQLVSVMVVVTSIVYLVICIVIAHFLPLEGEFAGFVAPAEDEAGREFFGLMRILLMGMSLPSVAAAFWIRGLVKRRGAVATIPPGPFPPPDTPEGRSLPRLIQAMIVSMAFAETPGIFGLVMFLIMGGFAWLGVFLGISFVAKIALFPRWSEIEEMVEGERLRKLG
ncbi:MAG: hypothetical protein ACYS9X_18295 [Planctomycetota bacterium]|jgi:hypothetical protein